MVDVGLGVVQVDALLLRVSIIGIGNGLRS